MIPKTRTLLVAALALAVCMVLGPASAWAKTVYLSDGAVQQTDGTWDLPTQGTCSVGTTGYTPVPTTRPECLALRFPAYDPNQAFCEAQGASPNNLAWTTSLCTDPANDGNQTGCEAIPGRMYANGKCTVTMKDHSRNIGTCNTMGGTWVTLGLCTGKWNAPSIVGGLYTGNGTGDQCLRCHNLRTQYNGTDIRWVGESYMKMGHMNMARKVLADPNGTFLPWAGPAGHEYPSDDSGNVFDWLTGKITISSVSRDVAWIYGDWLAPLPRVIAKLPASTSQVCSDPRYTTSTCVANGGVLLYNAGASYSCSRCHMTGATSDATIMTGKEPERSFPGITWDRNSNANANLVNLSWGVKDDANKYASWDQWGIQCARCHTSVVDDTRGSCALTSTQCTASQANCEGGTGAAPFGCGGTWNSGTSTCTVTYTGGIVTALADSATCTTLGGTFTQSFNAPIGMGRHTSNATVATTDGGYCSDSRYTQEARCESSGKIWFSDCGTDPVAEVCTNAAATSGTCTGTNTWVPVAGWCSGNPSYGTDQTACTANGFTWTTGYCRVNSKTDPDLGLATKCSGGSGTNALSYRRNGSIQACLMAPATWNGGFPSCSEPAICTKPGNADYATCVAAGGTWTSLNSMYTCLAAGHEYTGTKTRRGPIITSLCMECHRQETTGMPYADLTATAGDPNTAHPGTYLKVGPAHGTVAAVSHAHGNQFLNSPHGEFTGTFNQIATAKLGSGYASDFQEHGEAANTGNGCTGCHDPHKSTVHEANSGGFLYEECTECHSNPAEAAEVPQVDLAMILHAGGPGTPLEEMDTDPAEPCIMCHMPEGLHLWRINTSAVYSTFPTTALTATVNANTSPDGSYTNAVWTDLDHACGQCHGGGIGQASTTGSVAAASKVLTVASKTGFAAGSKVRIAGAGALEEDGLTRGDFDTYIVTVDPNSNTLNLAGGVTATVAGADVFQNPTTALASYKTKVELAGKAAGIHTGTPAVPPLIMFSYSLATPDTLTVNVDASDSSCSGSSANCDAYTWSWGDGATGSGVTAFHTYASAGAKTITLTVEEYGVSGGTSSKTVTVYAPDYPPVAVGTCVWDPNTWTMTVNDSSTDDNGVAQVTVNWGDGSMLSSDTTAPFGPFTRTYLNVLTGGYTITHKAIDTIGQQNTKTCTASPAYFLISGTVTTSAGLPVASATVTVKKGSTTVKTVYTAANGTYSAGSLKPGTYTLYVTKSGYTFPSPSATATIGPSSTGNVIPAAPGTTGGGGGSKRKPIETVGG